MTAELLSDASSDEILTSAVDHARAAAVEVGGRAVGEHLGVEVESPAAAGPTLTHSFASTDKAYVGWRWAVTLARADGFEQVTVDEVVLLPGAGALLAHSWVPWAERVQAGDLAAGDLLPPSVGDDRLVAAYADPEAELADEVFWELGLGRSRVLSTEGRIEAAERWWDGPGGPDAPISRKAPGRCGDCGFLAPLGGGLRQAFGVCANGYAPDDGRVVALTHGCGAHSETVLDGSHSAIAGMAVEGDEYDMVPAEAQDSELDAPAADLVVADPEPAVVEAAEADQPTGVGVGSTDHVDVEAVPGDPGGGPLPVPAATSALTEH